MANNISRLEKLENISGEKYPRDFPGRETIAHVLSSFQFDLYVKKAGYNNDPRYIKPEIFKIAGRISARRGHKDNIFFDIFDQTGSIQLHAKWEKGSGEIDDNWRNGVTNKTWDLIQETDIGDMVGVEGTIGQNPRGEPLLAISNFITLAKALKDPPANFHGVKNPELKYRHREQDLLSSAETRELFKTRAQIVFEIRKYLNERDFIEIETPILQPIYGGATARPFVTRHHALNQDFYLAISSELFLKRAMVGGFDRVYSINRCFRNEGISPEHNPEFTNLEIFETCKTADDMEKFTENIFHYLWMLHRQPLSPVLDFKKGLGSAQWPLSRKGNPNPSAYENEWEADAWEMYCGDMEIASGATDLNDPREQEARLEESEVNAITRSENPDNAEFDPMDKNYIEALEIGALPWAGVGIGVDRLVMLLTGKTNIRDAILFPTLRSL